MQLTLNSTSWNIELSKHWDVLGPFPIHAREQHFLSPSFPLNLSETIDWNKLWPSSYADQGLVGWTKTTINELGELQISFPTIRWRYLRSFEGWAALQHHAVLRTTFKVARDRATDTSFPSELPKLLVHLRQGSYFTVLPKESFQSVTPKWYAGNIYNLVHALPQAVILPPSESGEYQLFVSGDYEIRLFGDPEVQGLEAPTQRIKLDIKIDVQDKLYVRESTLDVVPNFVAGWSFGDAIGIGLRAVSEWITVKSAIVTGPTEALSSFDITLLLDTRIAPVQTRIIPLLLFQKSPFEGSHLNIVLSLEVSGGQTTSIPISLKIQHLDQWSDNTREPILGSFFFAHSVPSVFSALPPSEYKADGGAVPPIVALHGAGVDIVETRFWADAMPNNRYNWILMPTGRTSWGLDWHGPSTQDIWEALSALSKVLSGNDVWKKQSFPSDTRVFLIGHSNGGQGTWHIATHYPDRVIAAVPAAAYMKPQAYIPLTHARSGHFIDPALRAILETSLTPDDNDIHLSNVAQTPILAIHGGSDENVPSWHSRALISSLKTLTSSNTDIARLKEDPGKGHWYSTVLQNEEVQSFLEKYKDGAPKPDPYVTFTLTVSSPAECGHMNGFRIHDLTVYGRLGKLHIQRASSTTVKISSLNVDSFSVVPGDILRGVREVILDDTKFDLDEESSFPLHLRRHHNGGWRFSGRDKPPIPIRLQSILTSSEPLIFVFSTEEELSLATRLAQTLQVYHRLDSEIISDSEAYRRHTNRSWHSGNIVVIGKPTSKFVSAALGEQKTAFGLKGDRMTFNKKPLQSQGDIDGQGYLFLHPHPAGGRCMLFMIYSTNKSLERLGKLFPIRTGVVSPAWLITGPAMDQFGAAGMEGAGLWNSQWQSKEHSSWLG